MAARAAHVRRWALEAKSEAAEAKSEAADAEADAAEAQLVLAHNLLKVTLSDSRQRAGDLAGVGVACLSSGSERTGGVTDKSSDLAGSLQTWLEVFRLGWERVSGYDGRVERSVRVLA